MSAHQGKNAYEEAANQLWMSTPLLPLYVRHIPSRCHYYHVRLSRHRVSELYALGK